jgi:tRNA pseudouridine55 synthase
MSKSRIPKYVVLDKKRGETPLETINAWKNLNQEFLNVPASYAGRLDPMAEGKLLVLLGEECKKQTAYTKLGKEYEIEILFDVKTDTGDVLGFPFVAHLEKYSKRNIDAVLKNQIGSHSRKYPVFSSKTVEGKPLFVYALEGTLDTIRIPEHIETIYTIKQLENQKISKNDLQKRIRESLALVPRSDEPSKILGADFRQDAIRAAWEKLFSESTQTEFLLLRLSVTCGSGTYMRTLAERIGREVGTTAFALSIRRTRIGKYVALGPLGFWSREYR